jgi:transposase
MSVVTASYASSDESIALRVRELESKLAAALRERDQAVRERDKLRRAYDALLVELERLRRRIYLAKAERVDIHQLEIEFAQKRKELEKLTELLAGASDVQVDGGGDVPAPSCPETTPATPSTGAPDAAAASSAKSKASGGRRNLRELDLPQDRCEVRDPALEGSAILIGFDESAQIAYRKGGLVCFIIARAKYKQVDEAGVTTFPTPESPKVLFPKTMAAPTLMAHVICERALKAVPFCRQEDTFQRYGFPLDRGTMSRWNEDVGMTLGPIVQAAFREAMSTAFCLATDATGIAIQPGPRNGGPRRPCNKGHFFVILADRDHVFFEYQAKHTSDAVGAMFHGFSGYIQADAHCVYDALFRGEYRSCDDEAPPKEVGCLAHARRKLFEAAAAKDPVAREALFRLHMLFENEEAWRKLPPEMRKRLRLEKSKPLLDDLFLWAEREYVLVKEQRGLLRTALGYLLRHREAFLRFLDDGRLRIDNNASERAIRTIALARANWLFCGSDDHAQAMANIFSLVASCKLHGLDPECYLADMIRVFAQWPRERYLELAPRYWTATRARLDPEQLARPVGFLTVPPPE